MLIVIDSCNYPSEAKLRQLTKERTNGFLRKFGVDITIIKKVAKERIIVEHVLEEWKNLILCII